MQTIKALLFASSTLLAIGVSAQTRFKTQTVGDKWWLFSTQKYPFVSFGVCGVNTGESFATYDPLNPAYAAFRYYPDRSEWSKAVTDRLQNWHFNTLGSSSDVEALGPRKDNYLYATPVLSFGDSFDVLEQDLWNPRFSGQLAEIASNQAVKGPSQARIIGYFSESQREWWEGVLFDNVWKSEPNSGLRRRFVGLLVKSYGNWEALVKDFVTISALNFKDLLGSGRLFLRPGHHGMQLVQLYSESLAGRYFEVCKEAIAKADPGALYLGERFNSTYYPEIARAEGKYAETVSTNLMSDWSDGGFCHYYLPTLAKICQRPIFISAYSSTTGDGPPQNKEEGQNGRASRAEVETKYLLSQPYIVGLHWLKYTDDPKGEPGRVSNLGIVDSSDKPYEPLTNVFSKLEPSTIHATGSAIPVDATNGIPVASANPVTLDTWNRNASYLPPIMDSGRADLYVSYAPDAVYVGIYWAEDRFSELFYQDKLVPEVDNPQIHLKVGKEYVTLSVPQRGQIKVTGNGSVIGERRGVRNEIIVKMPGSAVADMPLAAGQTLKIDAGLSTRGRAYYGRWQGNYSLGSAN